MPDELTPSQVAARLGTTTRSVQRWIALGALPARRVGGRWRVAFDAFDAFVSLHDGSRVPTTSAATDPAPRAIGTLFIANRGEIASRIARTCERMGIRAVIPETDGPDALDLLDPVAVVAAALGADADALHPGFGFLAENAGFAEGVERAGIAWVGPPPEAIRAMGDKAAARRLASSLGVPTVPGYDGDEQTDEALREAARAVGYPLLVKPSAGGGGKGMRIVRDPAGLHDAIAASRREAASAFGDDRLILERYLEGPRHVEIQVLFDRHGNGIHLGERDCSIQRRHQKILEETPSPAVDPVLRERMGGAALALAGAVGYVGAGTCEFLLDDAGSFHFLEMNTRLQVEHPVTEAVTGRDLVADQLRIAAGEPLGLEQAEVRAEGHAVEVRLYAEDPEAGFLPATGRIEALLWPAGDGIRIDAGIEAGTTIGGRFDPMLAKVIAHGQDRTEALSRLAGALERTVVLGLTTNLRFLRWLVRQPAVLRGEARIDTLEHAWPPEDWPEQTRIPDEIWQVAATHLTREDRGAGPWMGGWRLNAPAVLRVATEGEVRAVRLTDEADPHEALTDREDPADQQHGHAPAAAWADGILHVDVDGRSVPFRLAPAPDVDRAARAAAAHGEIGPVEIVAPMPGAVLAVHVAPGDRLGIGDRIITLEAMKMEHAVTAPSPGRVAGISVRAGAQVTRGQLLATIEP
jgi:acetyl-CoA/propionyl-CoA carboxylase, biotin carboxylase, biotin carboxyl carrier protein